MWEELFRQLLQRVEEGSLPAEEAFKELQSQFYMDLGFAKIDTHREKRQGYPEVIFCQGKEPQQVAKIIACMDKEQTNVLATRVNPDTYHAVRDQCPAIEYHERAALLTLNHTPLPKTETYIAVVTAGTADMRVGEEAAITAEFFGNRVERVYDIGVAGIHRLFANLPTLRGARVLIVIAGMEGALPSVVGGLVDKPVLAVPTSVGYGASLGGLAALLAMLNTCASGVSVVNIDNGFGAGYMASQINHL